jgi:hypothetical protein
MYCQHLPTTPAPMLTRSLLHEGHWLVRADGAFGYIIWSSLRGVGIDEPIRSPLTIYLESMLYLDNLESV